MNPLKQTGSKTIIYSSLCVSVILFIYAISTLITHISHLGRAEQKDFLFSFLE
ncbi:hypothetical protein [Anoxybacillus sp. FSL W8-1294]|uniref:hypothetical protein n=1 Tax=Anoxybacillus sp. FSL W8-1294 TaxID=2954655 RepID=UPI0030CE0C9D